MECADFFEVVEERLGERYVEPTTSEVGRQCVVEFYHPRVVERLGTDGLVTRFNRSGVVWASPVRRLRVKLRVTDPHDEAVDEALARSPLPFDRTDHRVVGAPDGEMVTVLHFSAGAEDLSRADLVATLDAVDEALAV